MPTVSAARKVCGDESADQSVTVLLPVLQPGLPEQGKPRAWPLGLKTVPRNAPRNACIRLVIEVLSAPDSAQSDSPP